MNNQLILLSGADIPFIEAQIAIHQPTLKEISYIGQQEFFGGCQLLRFNKNKLNEPDKSLLQDKDDFDIIIALMNENGNINTKNGIAAAYSVLALLFPTCKINIINNQFVLIELVEIDSNGQKKQEMISHTINKENYPIFKQYLNTMFCIQKNRSEKEYNPKGPLAKQIAEKLRQGRQRAAKNKPAQKVSILSRYASILAVGCGFDINQIMNLTVYQLFDLFERYQMKVNYEVYLEAKMAGAKDLKDVEYWMVDIHDQNRKKDE